MYNPGCTMRKKLTITIDERIYDGLYRVAGRRRISRLIESLVRSHLGEGNLDLAYRQMAGRRPAKPRRSNGPMPYWTRLTSRPGVDRGH